MVPSLDPLLTAAGALGAVVALIVLAGRVARRIGPLRRAGLVQERGPRRLMLIDTLALDRVRRVCIVRCDGRDMVVLTGGGSDSVVGFTHSGDAA